MSREEMALICVGLLFGLNAWFVRRLVQSIDEFKSWARDKMEGHDEAIATMKERHRLEDIVGVVPRSHH